MIITIIGAINCNWAAPLIDCIGRTSSSTCSPWLPSPCRTFPHLEGRFPTVSSMCSGILPSGGESFTVLWLRCDVHVAISAVLPMVLSAVVPKFPTMANPLLYSPKNSVNRFSTMQLFFLWRVSYDYFSIFLWQVSNRRLQRRFACGKFTWLAN